MTKAGQMALAVDIRNMKTKGKKVQEERAKRERLHADAVALVAEFPHTGPTRNAMWAVATIGLEKCRELAKNNLSGWHFRKAVAK